MKIIHYCTGLILSAFVAVHIFNHLLVLWSEETHIKFMTRARKIYRQPVIERLIGIAVLLQIISGLVLVLCQLNKSADIFKRIQLISGIYLAFFMIIHVVAIIKGRYKLHVDTNLYYGAGVMNMWPHKLLFIPYYSLAIISFFFHIACIHKEKMSQYISTASAEMQCLLIMFAGVIITAAIILRMTSLKSRR